MSHSDPRGAVPFLVAVLLAACGSDWRALRHDARPTDATTDATLDAQTRDAAGSPADSVSERFDVSDANGADAVADGGCAAMCSGDQTCCDGACVDLLLTADHCGSCARRCGGTVCLGGQCTSTCAAGRLDCDGNVVNGCEVDAATDPSHCGSCSRACQGTQTCTAGTCACVAGVGDCDGVVSNGCESDLQTDGSNCGACNRRCAAGQACTDGQCGCSPGFRDCDALDVNGCEVDTRTDSSNCGACGHSCGANAVCVAGACECTAGFLSCAATFSCSIAATDPAHCGACGLTCTAATPVCGTTGCSVGCSSSETRCGASCVATASDLSNCGACDVACPAAANASAQCQSGRCGIECLAGFANCDGDPSNGCEVDTRSSSSSCGHCSTACDASQYCWNGACTCATGLLDCGGGHCASCCRNSDCIDGDACTTDVCALGMCRHDTCAGGTLCCSAAAGCNACCTNTDCTTGNLACGPGGACNTCLPGYQDCNGGLSDGCETNLRADPANCGACGAACSFAYAQAVCREGTCEIGACSPGFADCDHNPASGCEADLASTSANCGACGVACAAGTFCSSGSCLMTPCLAGRGNCDGIVANGCETNITADPGNCGSCMTTCAFANAGATCVGGVCTIGACAPGYGNCDGLAVNGCETSVLVDPNHCGSCGGTCTTAMFPNAGAVCVAGVCSLGPCRTGFADCDGSPANGCEANLTADPARCGACSTACGFAHASAGCAGGACAMGACDPGYGNCDGSSANGCESAISSDPSHCGGCSTACSPTQFANAGTVCVAGSCSLGACNAGFANCDASALNGCEANLAVDAGNCGRCAAVCLLPHAAPTCAAGSCAIGVCFSGFGNCDGASANGCETALSGDTGNCGSCGAVCSPGLFPHASPVCAGGACALGACAPGYANCDGLAANGCEANLATDASHCGACAGACSFAHAASVCAGGVCALGACAAGWADCDGSPANGCEVYVLGTDAMHCGSCAGACALPQSVPACAAGACVIGSCSAGFANCDGLAANGCETDILGADANHCGSCATVCAFAHAGAACVAGSCVMGACSTGFADCDGLAANGCETNVGSDATHCGSCTTVCAFSQAAASCASGVCVMGACAPSYANCDGLTANGCETNPSADVNHCGSCTTVCGFPNAAASCVSGACTMGACSGGYANCDGAASSGCETAITSDPTNCGGCGTICAFANATAVCAAGICAIGTCNPNFGDCDSNPANGCETDLRTSGAHCGGCGAACPSRANATIACSNSVCTQTCLAGYADCNGLAADGCEVFSATDPAHCGLCTTACGGVTNATSSCAGGSCGFACSGYFLNCDGNVTNGCETNGSASVTNCGGCGVACNGGPHGVAACAPLGGTGAPQCALACTAGWADCDGSLSNGCEVNLGTNPSHCGACPTVCAGATPNCAAGVCVASCGGGLTTCSRACVSLPTDPLNCGSCGRVCTGGTICSSGNCVTGVSCSTPLVACNGSCVNNQTDPANCGACNNVCRFNEYCGGGECRGVGDACASPASLPLTPGPMAFTLDTTVYEDSANSCSTGRDAFLSFTLAQREIVYVDSFSTTGSTITRLMLFDSCGSLTTSCAANSCGSTQAQTWAVLTAGTHMLEVDTPTAGTVRLVLQHIPLAVSGGLPTGTQLPASFALTGTTAAASNSASSCGLGPDVGWYWVTCPSGVGGTLSATVCGASTFDTVLQLLNGNQVGGSCNNDACGSQSTLSAPVSAGAGVHLLYMDGAAVGNSGAFTVTGTRP